MSDFLVGKFKSLEAAESLKVGSKTVTNLIDSAAVSSQITSQVGDGGIDSATASSLIDSAFVEKFDSDFDTRFATKTTDNVSEGPTNLYFTNARVDNRIPSVVDSAYVQARQVDLQETLDLSQILLIRRIFKLEIDFKILH